jgi:hypothetical protein
MINPVDKKIYCDHLLSEEAFATCGINALAHFTMLNPDRERMIMMRKKQFKELEKKNAFVNINEFDGDIIIEVWKYSPVTTIEENGEWVDKLSLALSLMEDDDPRVEGEVERMIKAITWKD